MASRRTFIQMTSGSIMTLGLGIRSLLAQSVVYLMGGPPGPETIINGRRCLYFGGTGYYAFQEHPELIRAAHEALDKYGMHTATSRNIYGTTPLYREVEEKAAQFFGTEDAVYLPSGYLSNIAGFQGLIQTGQYDMFVVDAEPHWSISDFIYAMRKPVYTFAHGDPDDLRKQLKAHVQAGERPLVVSDGIFPTFGIVAPVREYFQAVEPYQGAIWIDDAHGVGVLGAHGRGTYEYYGLASDNLFFGGTLSKSVGGHGGIVPGKKNLVQAIRAGHIVNGANASPSPAAAAAVQGMTLLMEHPELRERLWMNARTLKAGLKQLGFPMQDSPVPIAAWRLKSGEEMDRIHAELLKREICIQRTRYVGAGPEGALRAVVFATHTTEQIQRLLAELKSLV
jgi:glycine C-acetyltransferase/8-amino-7-oxononanoate synthase